jgi:hypothetical protein
MGQKQDVIMVQSANKLEELHNQILQLVGEANISVTCAIGILECVKMDILMGGDYNDEEDEDEN